MNLSLVQSFLANLVRRQSRLLYPKGSKDYATIEELLEKLMSSSGEISAMVTGREILNRYGNLNDEERLKFFRLLDEKFNADADEVRIAYREYERSPTSLNLRNLSNASEPRRRELLRRLNQTAGATHDLVTMRAELLETMQDHPELAAVDSDFVHLFYSWFARSFLILQTIDWSTPAAILERIIRYESVHEIHDWEDLRRRIEPENRRCFAFFHPALIDEPLIFVEVALSEKIPASIGEILQAESEEQPNLDFETATFYSISNCQPGLRKISFGNFLIKQVVQELQAEFPTIKNFVTLSPLPRFSRWVSNEDGTLPEDLADLVQLIHTDEAEQDEQLHTDILRRLTAEYLVNARKGIHPVDPVARFHLSNGALLHRIHVDADSSAKGLEQSHGVMVNYLYDLRYIERNHEQFMTEGVIDHSSEIQKILQKKIVRPK